jgi:putative ABC transport system substrate-binding protein
MQFDHLGRREFIRLLGVSAVLWPSEAPAQSPVPTLGFLSSGPANARQDQVAMLFRGLSEGGYTEGKNLAVVYRWAGDRYERLPELAAELVGCGFPSSPRRAAR